MSKIFTLFFALFFSVALFAQKENYQPRYKSEFEQIYQSYNNLPKGILEAVAFSNTRVRHVNPKQEMESCMGLPSYYGVMGLVDDGKNYFRNNLQTIAQLSKTNVSDIKANPYDNIQAYAEALTILANQNNINSQNPADYIDLLRQLSELPLNKDAENDFALNSQLYVVFAVLNEENFQTTYDLPNYQIDLINLFGATNYEVLSSTRVDVENGVIKSDAGTVYQFSGAAKAPCSMPNGPAEYAPAIWDPADASNYSSYTIAPFMVAIHTIQGSYAGAISWFKNPTSDVSAHYTMRSFDGQVTQQVCHKNRGWHVGVANSNTVGIEHEGYVADGIAWYTNAMYLSSADLVTFISQDISSNLLQTFDGIGTVGVNFQSDDCVKIKGHGHFAGNTHTDPGVNWDWERYYRLLNPQPTANIITTTTGTLYDSGGATGNYANEERSVYAINPPGNAPIQLTFNSWDLEDTFDFLWIYEGTDNEGALIGKYSGTSPGTVTINSGECFIEFRSNCVNSRAGWEMTWNTTTTACANPTNLSETYVGPMMANLTWDSVTGATSYNVRYKTTMEANWTIEATTSNAIEITGLTSGAEYYWQVQTVCAGGNSSFSGKMLNTTDPGKSNTQTENYVVTSCSGTFRDAGGAGAPYLIWEDWTYTIQPQGATAITMVFSSFETETTYDKLYVYDGATTNATLIGTYMGTNSPGTITSSGGALTFKFISDSWTIKPGWDATWTSTGNCVSTGGGGVPSTLPTTSINTLSSWKTADFTANYTDVDNSTAGLNQQFYQVVENNGQAVSTNTDNGFLYDNFNGALSTNWTNTVGIWGTSGGTLVQSDEANSNTNLNISIAQANETYLYHWRMKMSGSGTNRRAGLHFYSDNGALTQRGNSYLVYFRADNNKTQIYKAVADVIGAPETDDNTTINATQWYDYKVTFNPTTGEINAYQNDVLVSSWTDPTPFTSANSVSLRSGNCNAEYEDFRVYKIRNDSTLISVGSGATKDVRFENANPQTASCIINSLVSDNTNQWSALETAYVNIDWTPPATVTVNDGAGADIDTVWDNTQLVANWTASADTNSGITTYWYKIGTTPNASDVLPLTDNGNNTIATITGLNLAYNTTYYITVIAENGAGLQSSESVADGVLVLETCTTIPSTTTDVANNWYLNDFIANFTDTDSCLTGIKHQFYQPIDFNGTEWRGNNANGFFNDNFDIAIHPDWTNIAGNWAVSNTQLVQTDEVSSNTNIYATVAQDNASKYLYEWEASIDGAGTNRRGGLHFFSDDATLTNRGNSYFVYFRADNNSMQIYSVTNDVFTLEKQTALQVNVGQTYNHKIVYDPITGTIEVYRDNVFIDAWTDATPLTTGAFISFRTGNCTMAFDNLKVYKTRGNSENIAVGQVATDDLRYQNTAPNKSAGLLKTLIIDNGNLVSETVTDSVNIDWTKPNAFVVNDGFSTDISVFSTINEITANWTDAIDNQSGIIEYEYAIGTAVYGTDVINWTTNYNYTIVTDTTVSLTVGTTYYVSVKAYNGVGMDTVISSNGQLLTLAGQPPVVSNNATYCIGDNITAITATPLNGGTVTWYSDAALSSQLGTGTTYTPSNIIGTTTYYATETYNGTESPANSVTIVINGLPTANAGNDTLVCENETLNLTATGGVNYSWSNGINTAENIVAPSTLTTYTVTVTDANNCSNTAMVVVSVQSAPIASFIATDGINYLPDYTEDFTNNSTNSTSYIWDFGDGNSATASNTQNTYADTGSYWVKLTATNAICTTASVDSALIIVIDTTQTTVPVVSASFTTSATAICSTDSIQLINTSQNGTSYEWFIQNGSPAVSNEENPYVQFPTSGTYNITLIAYNSWDSDTLDTSILVQIFDAPVAGFTSSATTLYLPNAAVQFTNQSVNYGTTNWSFGNGDSSATVSPAYTYQTAGIYSVSLVVSNNGCAGADTLTKIDYIQVIDTNIAPITSFILSDTIQCQGDSIQLINTTSASGTYEWMVNNSVVSTEENPYIQFAGDNYYAIELSVTNLGGTTTASSVYFIDVISMPTANFTTSTTQYTLPNATVSFTNLSTDYTLSSWTFGDGDASFDTNPWHNYTAAGDYTVELTVSNQCGQATETKTNYINVLEVGQLPVAAFQLNVNTICEGNAVDFTNNSQNATSYSWLVPGGTPATSSDANPTITFNSSGQYLVQLIAYNGGSSDTTSQTVYVEGMPQASFTVSDTVVEPTNGIVGFTNTSSNATTYFWNFDDGNTSTNASLWNDYTSVGTYNVLLIASNGVCPADTAYQTIVVQSSVGMEELSNEVKINIYPNPVADNLTIIIDNATQEAIEINLYDLAGKLVATLYTGQINYGNNQLTIAISNLNLSKGIYNLNIKGTTLNANSRLMIFEK